MIFKFVIWYKSKLFNDVYVKRRFAVDLGYMPVNFIQGHIIKMKEDGEMKDVKCTLVTFHDGTKKIAVDQYTSFIKEYEDAVNKMTQGNLPSAN